MPGVVRTSVDTHVGHPCPEGGQPAHTATAYNSAGQSKVFSDGHLVVNKGGGLDCGDTVNGERGEVSSKVFAGNQGVHRQGDATHGHGCWVPSTAASGSSKVFAD